MDNSSFNKRNRLYIQYNNIGANSYREKVRFYEKNIQHQNLLSYDDQFEVDIDYLLALFEIGKYVRFLERVDEHIERVIIDNIVLINGENIFNLLLFKKAACLYNLEQYEESERILKQLSNIDTDNEIVPKLRYRCMRRINRQRDEIIKAISIVLLLCAVSIKFAELLVIEPFYDEYLDGFYYITTTLFVLGFGIFALYEVFCQYCFVKGTK